MMLTLLTAALVAVARTSIVEEERSIATSFNAAKPAQSCLQTELHTLRPQHTRKTTPQSLFQLKTCAAVCDALAASKKAAPEEGTDDRGEKLKQFAQLALGDHEQGCEEFCTGECECIVDWSQRCLVPSCATCQECSGDLHGQTVAFTMTIQHVDHAQLVGNFVLRAAFEMAIKQGVADSANVQPDQVAITSISAGSVVVKASVTAPGDMIASIESTDPDHIASSVATEVGNIPDVDSIVASGETIKVTDVSVVAPTTTAPPGSTTAPSTTTPIGTTGASSTTNDFDTTDAPSTTHDLETTDAPSTTYDLQTTESPTTSAAPETTDVPSTTA